MMMMLFQKKTIVLKIIILHFLVCVYTLHCTMELDRVTSTTVSISMYLYVFNLKLLL